MILVENETLTEIQQDSTLIEWHIISVRWDLTAVEPFGIQRMSREDRYYLLATLHEQPLFITYYVPNEPRTIMEVRLGPKRTRKSNAEVRPSF